MPKFYFIQLFSLLSSLLLSPSLSSQESLLANSRELAFNFYGSKYGSPVFPITNYGNDFYVVKVPLSMGDPHIPLVLMPYSSQSWFSSIKNFPLDRIMLICDLKSPEFKTEYISYSGTGRSCQHSYEINHEQTLVFNYIYVVMTDYAPKGMTAGGLGLGISRDSFPISMTSKIELKHSIYLSENQEAYSHILFGGQDPRFYTGDALAVLKVDDASIWSFEMSELKIVNNDKKTTVKMSNKVILDPNFPYIHFPADVLDSLTNSLIEHSGGTCHYNSMANMLTCECEKIRKLEFLEFNMGGSSIKFPAEMMLLYKDSLCHIKLSGTSDKETTYAHVLDKFSDYIIFGAAFMTYFYTVFSYDSNLEDGTLTLYKSVINGQRPEFDEDVMQNYSGKENWLKDVALGFAFIILMWSLYNLVEFILKKVKKSEDFKLRTIEMNTERTPKTGSRDQSDTRRDEMGSSDSFHFEAEEEEEEY